MLKPLNRHPQLNFNGIKSEVINEFEKGVYAKDVLAAQKAKAAQIKIHQHLGKVRRTIPGMGQAKMSIDPYVYWHWVKREGREVWNDSFHKKYFKKYFPETQVKTEKNMSRVGWEPPSNKGFSKNYGEI